MGEKTFYVTTPIYYANAKPHLGHAYTTLVVDSLTRFKRQRGIDAFFLTGTDEHGINIERAAEARGLPVREHVDQVVEEFKAAFARLGVEYDRWIRTIDTYHEETVQKLWRILYERGHIYKGSYEGWFCGYCNEFKDVDLPKAVIVTESGVQPICPIHERPLDLIAEESYFFRLSAFQKPLLDLYEKRPDFVQPDVRRNEVISFVAGGLKDLSISRVSVKWGIPVPGDPSHTIYVWLDALTNYISALGWGNDQFHDFDRYWPALHMVGKDILRFHAVYWPAFLMGAGFDIDQLPRVFVHGMLLRGGQKMGKTLGNAIQLEVLHRYFTNDQIRYYLLRDVAFGQDGEVTYEGLIDRVNSDLADGLGNLASRTLTMIRNYFGGVPPRPEPDPIFQQFNPDERMLPGTQVIVGDDDPPIELLMSPDSEVKTPLFHVRRWFEREFQEMRLSQAIATLWSGITCIDRFISRNEPWKLAKEKQNPEKLERTIAYAYEGLRHIILLAAPIIPVSAREIWGQMGLAGDPLAIDPNKTQWGEPLEVSRIDRISPAFPRLDKEKIMAEIENGTATPVEETKPQASAAEQPVAVATESGAPPTAQIITIDDFAKVELRAATVLEAEKVPKADKLLRLIIDVGEAQPRQILAGIAEHYAPEDVVGRKIIVVANLAPRKLRGLESNGMLLAASIEDSGRPVLATFGEEVPNGARLK